jgi:hypothetical protein
LRLLIFFAFRLVVCTFGCGCSSAVPCFRAHAPAVARTRAQFFANTNNTVLDTDNGGKSKVTGVVTQSMMVGEIYNKMMVRVPFCPCAAFAFRCCVPILSALFALEVARSLTPFRCRALVYPSSNTHQSPRRTTPSPPRPRAPPCASCPARGRWRRVSSVARAQSFPFFSFLLLLHSLLFNCFRR